MKFEVKWEPDIMDFYKYGSTIEFFGSNNVVYFKNEILSPGATLMTWSSHPQYHADRSLFQLPLLKRGKKYNFKVNAESFPEHSLLVQIEFLDRSQQVLSRQVIFDREGEVEYPRKAFSYRIKLLNNGIEELFFKDICIDA